MATPGLQSPAQTPNTPAARDSVTQQREAKEAQSLTLKVMRLSKPSFDVNLPILCEKSDIPGPVLNEMSQNGIEAFGVSEFLTLPHSFGNIFLGETFTCYLSVHNHSPFDVRGVTVKAELQTTTQKFCPLDIGASPIASFNSGESNDYVVSHDVKEIGIHILVCTVNYIKHDGEKKYFRKYFKFQVMNPLSIKTQTYDLQQSIFLEGIIQNATQVPCSWSRSSWTP
jgi:hypothetical protein